MKRHSCCSFLRKINIVQDVWMNLISHIYMLGWPQIYCKMHHKLISIDRLSFIQCTSCAGLKIINSFIVSICLSYLKRLSITVIRSKACTSNNFRCVRFVFTFYLNNMSMRSFSHFSFAPFISNASNNNGRTFLFHLLPLCYVHFSMLHLVEHKRLFSTLCSSIFEYFIPLARCIRHQRDHLLKHCKCTLTRCGQPAFYSKL